MLSQTNALDGVTNLIDRSLKASVGFNFNTAPAGQTFAQWVQSGNQAAGRSFLLSLAAVGGQNIQGQAASLGLTDFFNAQHAAGTQGFWTGGSFEVGGSGGVDSQLVQLKASPKEKISITTPGQEAQGLSLREFQMYRAQDAAQTAAIVQKQEETAAAVRDMKRSLETIARMPA